MDNYIRLMEQVCGLLDLKAKTYQSGDFLFHQGQHEPRLFWIKQGLVKMSFFEPNGKEFVKAFLIENDLAGSLLSVVFGKPSPYATICMEQSEIVAIPYAGIKKCVASNPALANVELEFMQHLTARKEDREYQFLCLSPEERYERFLLQYPDVYKRISQAELARFLGITPVALSRIKKRTNLVT